MRYNLYMIYWITSSTDTGLWPEPIFTKYFQGGHSLTSQIVKSELKDEQSKQMKFEVFDYPGMKSYRLSSCTLRTAGVDP